MAPWATPADVLGLTKMVVTEDDVSVAQGTIEIHVPLTTLENLSARDVEYLRKAVSYQTAWEVTQIEVNTRTDIASYDAAGGISGGGESFQYQGNDAAYLAPKAKRCIDRLSWNRSGPAGGTPIANYTNLSDLEAAVLRDEEPATSWYGWRCR